MTRTKARTKASPPWWLAEDNEACGSCSHAYAHRTEIYCFDCDAAICPVCIVKTEALEFICPGCQESRKSEEVV